MGSDIEHLQTIPLYRGLSEKDLQVVFDNAQMRRFPADQYAFSQGEPAERMYVLRQGKVKLGQITPDGQQVILNVIGPWEMFGLIAFVPDGVYPVSAQTAVDSEALSWSHETLQRLAGQFPLLSANAMGILTKRIHEFQHRIIELSTERVERRLARVLLRLVRQVGKKMPEGVLIDLPITRQDLAEMSGTTLYTVSRLLSQWEREGILDGGRERVLIRFPHGLVRIAEDLPTPDETP